MNNDNLEIKTSRMYDENGNIIFIAAGDGLKSIDHWYYHIQRGEVWTYDNTKLAVADAGTYVLRVKTGAKRLHVIIDWVGEFKTRFKTYAGSTVTSPGTRVYPFNRQPDTSVVLLSEFYEDSVFTGGTLRGNNFKGQTGNVLARAGGETQGGLISDIPPNSEFIIELTNVGGEVADLAYIINCYEE